MDYNIQLLMLGPVVFIAGCIDAIAGGGGLLTVPAYLLCGISPTLTLGTNKFVSSVGTIVSTAKYAARRRILWPVAIVGIGFTILGSVLGAHTVAVLHQNIVRKIILVALPVAAVLTLFPKPKHHKEMPIDWRSIRLWTIIPLIALLLGWYDGFFGPGTGSLLILALYGIARLNFLHSAATARFFNLVSNLGALGTFLVHRQILFELAIPLSLFGIAGQYLGTHLALKRGDRLVRVMLAISCTVLFASLLIEYVKG